MLIGKQNADRKVVGKSFYRILIFGGIILGIFLYFMVGHFFSNDENLSLTREQETLLFDIIVPLYMEPSESSSDYWYDYEYGSAYQSAGLNETEKNEMKQIFSGFDLIKDGKDETVSYYSGFLVEVFVEDKDIYYVIRMYNVDDHNLFEVERARRVDERGRIWTFPEYGVKRLFSDEKLGTKIRQFMKNHKDIVDKKVDSIDQYVLEMPWTYRFFDENWWGGAYLSHLRDIRYSEKIDKKEAELENR